MVKIFALTKLDAVHKNADRNVLGFLFGAFNQREMPVVQIAHGGHKGNIGNGFAPVAQLGDGVEYVHGVSLWWSWDNGFSYAERRFRLP